MFEPDLAFFDSSSPTTTANTVEQQSQNYDQFPVIMNDTNKSMMVVSPYSRQAPLSSSSSSQSPTSEKSSSYCSSYDGHQQMLYNYHMDGYNQHNSQSLMPINTLYDPSSNNSVYSCSPSSSPQRSLYCSSPAGSISSASSTAIINNNNNNTNYITNHMQQQLPLQQQQQSFDQKKFSENSSYTSIYPDVYDGNGYQEQMYHPQQLTSEYGSDGRNFFINFFIKNIHIFSCLLHR